MSKCKWIALLLLFAAAGCRRDMQDQPRYDMYRPSEFFSDKASLRPIPAHTVARGFLREDDVFYTGRTAPAGPRPQASPTAGGTVAQFDPDLVATIPMAITPELLNQGQEQFQTFCSMCHGLTGEGDGMIVRRGFKKPPSYHEARLRTAPAGHFFDVMTNGWGAMPAYNYLVPLRNRWMIVAYIRALQLSRNAKLEELPEDERQRLGTQASPRAIR